MSTFTNRPWIASNQERNAVDIMHRLHGNPQVVFMPVHADPQQYPLWPTADFAVLTGVDDVVLRVNAGASDFWDLWYKATDSTSMSIVGCIHRYAAGTHFLELDPTQFWQRLSALVKRHGIRLISMPKASVYPTLDPLNLAIVYCDYAACSTRPPRLPVLTVSHRNAFLYLGWPNTTYNLPTRSAPGIAHYWPQIPYGLISSITKVAYVDCLTKHPAITALPALATWLPQKKTPVISLATDNVTDPLYTLDQQPPGTVTPQMLEQWVTAALADPVCQQNHKIIGF